MSEPIETIHLYIVREDEAQQEQPVIDSSVQDTVQTDTQPLVQQSHRHIPIVPFIIIAANLSVVVAVFFLHIYPLLTATATITIFPKQAIVTAHLTLSNVQNRIFQPVSLTQTKTVPATGKGHQDATQASGTITLYNASIQAQTIAAGTLLIGSDGAHIVTDETVTIPGATPPLEGQGSVNTHAVNSGVAGNISAGDISGACCRENMFAYNSAFSGGAAERNFTMVTQQDIQGVVSSLLPRLKESIQTAFHQQVHPGELLTPTQCSQKIVTDRNVGDEATQVTITVTMSCIAGAYTSNDFHIKVQQALVHQAVKTLGGGYIVSSYMPTAPMKISIQRGTLVIAGIFQGRIIYRFSTYELTTLRQHLVGKSRQQGIAILSHLNGIEHVTVQVEKNGTFPTDPTHIHILFLIVS